ncbi:reverse transcriptase, partial [Corchorus olitorius]
ASFVPGRKAVDNVVVVKETLHYFKRKQGQIGLILVKLDLDKAYDRLEWDFIRKVLYFFQFPDSWINLIMSCVATSSLSILMNGERSEKIIPTRGLRQGDPLSPYLFILCIEYLSIMINKSCAEGHWKQIKLGRSGPRLSHLCFADDIILMGRADSTTALTMKEVLQKFCQISGQCINFVKSKIFFSRNVAETMKQDICQTLNINASDYFGTYLGFPMDSMRRRTTQYRFIIEKMHGKLQAWKARHLSMAGRAVLVKSTLSAIPSYYMQGTRLPSNICNEIDRVNRDLLWDSIDKKKLNLISWNRITLAKEGGLGVREAGLKNDAAMAKLTWRLVTERDSLWAQVLISRYCNSHERKNCSETWNSMKKGQYVFANGLRRIIGDGTDTKFWTEDWTGMGPLYTLCHGPLLQNEYNLTVQEVCNRREDWIQNLGSLELPNFIIDKLRAMPIFFQQGKMDSICWKLTQDGKFTYASAYNLARNIMRGDSIGTGFKWIWRIPTLPKIKFFIWLSIWNGIVVCDNLAQRGIEVNTICARCLQGRETIIHTLWDCEKSKKIWSRLLPVRV